MLTTSWQVGIDRDVSAKVMRHPSARALLLFYSAYNTYGNVGAAMVALYLFYRVIGRIKETEGSEEVGIEEAKEETKAESAVEARQS